MDESDAAAALTALVNAGHLVVVGWDCVALDEGEIGVRHHYAPTKRTPIPPPVR